VKRKRDTLWRHWHYTLPIHPLHAHSLFLNQASQPHRQWPTVDRRHSWVLRKLSSVSSVAGLPQAGPHDCSFLGPCGIEVLQIDDVRRSVPMMLEAYVLQKCILILHRRDAFPFFSFLFNCVPVGSSWVCLGCSTVGIYCITRDHWAAILGDNGYTKFALWDSNSNRFLKLN